MTPSRPLISLSVLAVAAGFVALATPGPALAGSGATRYASPSGSGSTCSAAHPCSLVTAVNHATTGQVIIGPGTYGSQQHQIATELEPEGDSLSIHGAANKQRPIIHLSAKIGFAMSAGVSLSNVQIDASGTNSGLFALGGDISHVIVLSNGEGATACAVYTSIVDSLCVARGEGGVALATTSGGEGPDTRHIHVTVRGVTAVATDQNGDGLLVAAGDFTNISVNATNDIFQGRQEDVESATSGPTATATINLSHSDFHHSLVDDPEGGEAEINGNATDVSKPARFVSANKTNFRETPSSPTIDKGAADPAHDTDLIGRPRRVGSAPDIGAYEFLQRPAITHLKKSGVTADSASLSGNVFAEGLRTEVRLVATHGGTVRESPWVTARNKLIARHVRLTVHGLAGHQSYVVRMVARNPGGTTKSAPISVTTH